MRIIAGYQNGNQVSLGVKARVFTARGRTGRRDRLSVLESLDLVYVELDFWEMGDGDARCQDV